MTLIYILSFLACTNCTHLKKSSLQNSIPFLAKHLSANVAPHSLHFKQRACQVRSSTFKINLSRINS